MPGLSNGRNNPNDYILGRGIVYFSPHDALGNAYAYRDLGNCTEFTLSMEFEDLDHFSSRQGLKVKDRSVLLSQDASLAFTLDEWNMENLALWFSGTNATVAGRVGVAIIAGADNLGQGDATLSVGGRWYDLFIGVAGPDGIDDQADRIYDTGVITVATFTEGTHFLADRKMGRIFIIKGSTMDGVALSTLDVNIAAGAATADYTEARMFTGTPLRGSLKFIQVNPANNNELREWQFHSVQLRAEGDMALIGDDWATMGFTAGVDKNSTQSASSPYATVRTYVLAQGAVPD